MGADWYLSRIEMSPGGRKPTAGFPLSTTGGHCTHFGKYVNRIRKEKCVRTNLKGTHVFAPEP